MNRFEVRRNLILLNWIWKSFQLEVIKHVLFLIYIAMDTVIDMDTDRDGCGYVYTHVHIRVCIYIFVFSSSVG